jgi:hypothetical protein
VFRGKRIRTQHVYYIVYYLYCYCLYYLYYLYYKYSAHTQLAQLCNTRTPHSPSAAMAVDCHAFVSKITQSGRLPADVRHNIADFVCGVSDTIPQDILEKYAFELEYIQLLWPVVQGWKITETFVSHGARIDSHCVRASMELQFRTDRASIDFLWHVAGKLITVHADGSRRIKGLCIDIQSTSRRIPTLKEEYEWTMAEEAAAEAPAAATRAALVEARATEAVCARVEARAKMTSIHWAFKAAFCERVSTREACLRELDAHDQILEAACLAADAAWTAFVIAERAAEEAARWADETAAAAEEAAQLYGMATTRAATAAAAAEEAQDEAEEEAELYWMAMDSQ